MKPKKSLGQNFLINLHAARRIASLFELHAGESCWKLAVDVVI